MLEVAERYSDGKCPDVNGSVIDIDFAGRAIDTTSQSTLTAVDEVSAVVLDVKAHEVAC